jgi:hypothetical protein
MSNLNTNKFQPIDEWIINEENYFIDNKLNLNQDKINHLILNLDVIKI